MKRRMYCLMAFLWLVGLLTPVVWANAPADDVEIGAVEVRIQNRPQSGPVVAFRDEFADTSGLSEVDNLVAEGGFLQVVEEITWVLDRFEDFYPGYGRGIDLYTQPGSIVLSRFTPDVRVNDVLTGTQNQVRVASAGENLYAAWTDDRDTHQDIYFAHSTDAGLHWPPGSKLNLQGDAGDQHSPAIAANASSVHVVWEDAAGVHYTRSSDYGNTWEADTLLLPGAWDADIAAQTVSTDPLVYVLYSYQWRPGDVELGSKRSIDDGSTWGALEDVAASAPNDTTQRNPRLTMRPGQDQPWAVWEDDRDGEFNLYAAQRYTNGSWWNERVDDGPAGSSQADGVIFFLPSSGNPPACIWTDDRQGSGELYWARYYPDPVYWYEHGALTISGTNASRPAAVLTGSKSWAAWTAAAPAAVDTVWLQYYTDAWGPVTVAPDHVPNAARSGVALAQVNPGGLVAALWSDDRHDGGDVFVSTSDGQYMPTGVYTSTVHDFGPPADWGAVTWTGGGFGNITVQVRSGNTPEPDPSWSPWFTAVNGAVVPAPPAPYLQLRARLEGISPKRTTPVLERIQVAAVPREGMAVSLPVGQCVESWEAFSFDGYTPAGTTLTLSLLDVGGTLLYSDVNSPLDLSALDPAQHPRLRARVDMARSAAATPLLDWWQFDWEFGENRAALSLDPLSVYTPTVVQFFNHSTGTVAPAFSWDFGDGLTSTLAHPSHTYAAVGPYTVTLSAHGECGQDLATATLAVQPLPALPPQAGFDHGPTCPDQPVSFTDQSTGAIWWRWDFGDGAASGRQFPTHVYDQAGDYVLVLAVSNTVGADALSATLAVRPAPTAAFTHSTAGLTAAFTPSVSGDPALHWDFGDGTSSTLFYPVHVYTQAGRYTVTLTAANGCGQVEDRDVVLAAVLPQAGFASSAPACPGQAVAFTNTSSGSPPLAFWWEFGDGGSSAQEHPTHTYAAGGLYTVTLAASSPYGLDAAAGPVRVWQPVHDAALSWEPDLPAAGRVVTFSAAAGGSPPLTYTWSFGDGTAPATGALVTHSYGAAGAYSVVLSVSNACGPLQAARSLEVAEPLYRIYLPLLLADHYGGDAYEPDDDPAQAGPLLPGQPQGRDFAPAGDVDWAALELEAGQAYTIETAALGEGVDTALSLFAPGSYGTPLAENDDCHGYTYASCLTFSPGASGRYELRVENRGAAWGPAAGYVLEAAGP